jgi:glycosyltransferase involved in cell wall biosynthesis
MIVVFAHTDFRIYWPARLSALTGYLKERNIRLEIIEIAGAGSPYDFSGQSGSYPVNWNCLFPDMKMEDISAKEAGGALCQKLDKIKPDIVFAGAIAFPSGAAAVQWAAKNLKKVVIFDNARVQDVPRPRIVNFVKRSIYACADAVLCPSPAWNKTFNYFGLTDKQIFYGLNVVDNNFWKKNGKIEQTGFYEDYILTIGRQIPKKNFLFLLKAYLDYSKRVIKPKDLVLVGDGPKHQILEEFAKINKLNTVHFLPFQSQEKLKNIYRNAAYFILPSKYGETWGLVVNEAMASGLPVLVSNQAGCASTLVKEGINGYTFSPAEEMELQNLFQKMHEMPREEFADMGRNSLEIIEEWGLSRFCSGVHEAILWVSEQSKSKPNIMSWIILKLWYGRYRPL